MTTYYEKDASTNNMHKNTRARHVKKSAGIGQILFVSQQYLPPAYIVRREDNVFTGVILSVHGGGVPQSQVLSLVSGTESFSGGTHSQVLSGGYPVPVLGYPSPSWWDAPLSLGQGYPHWDWSTPQSGTGVPPLRLGHTEVSPRRECVPPGWDWGTTPPPPPRPKSEYLLCGRWYAILRSCRRTFLLAICFWQGFFYLKFSTRVLRSFL